MDLTPAAKRAFQIQSYGPAPSIDGVEIVELKRFPDDGGSMTELARLTDGHPQAVAGFTLRQVNYSEVEPGAIKAFHLHARQTDVWYVPPSDRCLMVLVDVRAGSPSGGVAPGAHPARRRARRAQPRRRHGAPDLLRRPALHRRSRDLRRRPAALG